MSQDLKAAFWDRIANVRAGLLSAGGARPVPMSPYADETDGALWFITAEGTDIERAAQSGAEARFSIADPKARLYGTVEGSVTQVTDPEKLDELWNAVAAAWFEDGRDDNDIRLLRFTPSRAEIWATDGAGAFLYEIAKSQLTDTPPDMGEHGVVSFAA